MVVRFITYMVVRFITYMVVSFLTYMVVSFITYMCQDHADQNLPLRIYRGLCGLLRPGTKVKNMDKAMHLCVCYVPEVNKYTVMVCNNKLRQSR